MSENLLALYNPAPIDFVHGEGVWLYDAAGGDWLDGISGIATNALGHCHPELVAALTEQAGKMWHLSNALRIPGQQALAARLTAACFADRAFFASTGTEAVECAIKMARRHHAVQGRPERIDIIGFEGAFHGRTYAAINAAANPAYLDGFGPAMPGFHRLMLDDHEAFATAVAATTTAAVIVEPVQGEGGARALSRDDLQRLRDLTRANHVLLIHDEVQSGMGRTGRLFAHQWFDGVAPDIMTLAKALGSGFPVSACLATNDAACGMTAGVHGTTFGGNPLGMAVATAAFDVISRPETLANAIAMSERLRAGLSAVRDRHPAIVDALRGKGLLLGIRLKVDNKSFIAAARAHRLLLAGGGDNILRMLPPLTITQADADAFIARFEATCADVAQQRELAA